MTDNNDNNTVVSDVVNTIVPAIENLDTSTKSTFLNSGWRPALGWICVVGFALLPLQQVAQIVLAICHSSVVLPNVSISIYIELLGMLGLGTLRTIEKLNNVNKP